MSNEQKLREALQAYQDANEMSPYGDYSKIEWESSAGPVNPSWGGGDCKKHGRWYGRCYSCSDEWDNLRKRADRDAYTARENALNAAKQLARQALATTEPEPTGMPELPPLPRSMYPNMQYQRMYIGNVYTADQMRTYGEQCWKAGYKHGAWGDKPAVNQQLTTEPFDEREAFTDDTKDALMAGRAYAQEALIRFDDAYDRHPSTEPERNAILTDIQLIDAAMAKGVKG